MKKSALMLLTVLAAAGACWAKNENQILVQMQIFKFMGDLPGKTSVDKPIWTTDDTPKALRNVVTVFSKGRFQLGKEKLEFKDGKCSWNDKAIPMGDANELKLPAEKLVLIYSPNLVMAEHSSADVKIASRQPLQYFEKRQDGLFELKEISLDMGLDIEITEATEDEQRGYIRLTDIVMRMRSVEKRKKVEGVNLAVGRPILGEESYVFYFRLRPGKDYGILIRPEHGRGGLLLRLRASSTRSRTIEESKQKSGK